VGRQSQEGERRVDLALEDLGRGRAGPQDQLLVSVASRELDELLGDERSSCCIVLFRPQLGDCGADLARPRLPEQAPQPGHPVCFRNNGAVDGRFVEYWDELNTLEIFSQVGAVSPLGHPP
jgi:hypothetical protein